MDKHKAIEQLIENNWYSIKIGHDYNVNFLKAVNVFLEFKRLKCVVNYLERNFIMP